MTIGRLCAAPCLAAAATLAFGAWPASAQSSEALPAVVLLESGPPAMSHIDVGTPGLSIGDYTAFQARLSRQGQPLGWLYGTKTLVALPGQAGARPDQGIFSNLFTFVLNDGTITISGVQSATIGPKGFKRFGAATERAIIGGTGRYAGVRGVLFTSDSKTVPDGKNHRFVFSGP